MEFDTTFPADQPATLPRLWTALAAQHCDLDMIKMRGCEAWTFGDVDGRSAAIARGLLAIGCGKGTRVGLLAPNGPDWAIAWLAINRIGAIATLLSTFFSGRELLHVLRDADVAVLLTANTYLNNDYLARLATGLPGLADTSDAGITIEDCPYLRSIWTVESAREPWIAGTLASLARIGAESTAFGASMLSAIERNVSPADTSLLIYTSGSMAAPKGVLHTHGAVVSKICFTATANTVQPTFIERGDRLVATPPFFWVGGLMNLACAMYHGACLICEDDHSDAAILHAICSENATHASFTETTFRRWRGKLPDAVRTRLKPIHTFQIPILNPDATIPKDRYSRAMGMTETFGPHAGDIVGGVLPVEAAGTVGRALGDMEYKLIDPGTKAPVALGQAGELCVRGPWLMEGMNKRLRHEIFDRDGFYHTGDLCELREDGFLFFKNRLGGMIKTSGANVSPEEVEVAIGEIAGVSEVSVVGVPDRRRGQMVVAVVVSEPGAVLDEAAIQQGAKQRLSPFKVPRRVLFAQREEIPRTPSNKVRKQALLDLIQDKLDPPPAAKARSF